VVKVEAYVAKTSEDLQGSKCYDPHLPTIFRERLVEAIKDVHAELLEPPEKVKTNMRWLQQWKPSVKEDINWAGVLNAGGSEVGAPIGGPAFPRASDEKREDDATSTTDQEPEFLTIGLIGRIDSFSYLRKKCNIIIQGNLMSESRRC
jgi:hypothetical protein